MQCCEVIVEVALEPSRDLNASHHEEEADSSNAANQNVSWKEADEVAELECAQGEKNEARQDGTEAVGNDGGGYNGLG